VRLCVNLCLLLDNNLCLLLASTMASCFFEAFMDFEEEGWCEAETLENEHVEENDAEELV
jgi:hypothetical protein